ncbi:hypothetical protein [Conexibacter sp. SYSU D00693]|uniref:hypothetical protein n=1 Tax=Conexibacter sp. SYSU D00693 TaxID=2812560 RepID=UPI00196A99E6|nr:hypothetical protein [Conexibacter sp. SYSU D00693]
MADPTAPGRHPALDVALDGRVAHGSDVVVVLGDARVAARTSWFGGPFHQLRPAAPVAAHRGDRLLLQDVDGAPLAAGLVLDPAAPRHGTGNEVLIRLRRVLDGLRGAPAPPPDEPGDEALAAADAALRAAGPAGLVPAPADAPAVGFLVRAGRAVALGDTGLHVHARAFARAEEAALARGSAGAVRAQHLAQDLGVPAPVAAALLAQLVAERVLVPGDDGLQVRGRR